MKRGKYDVRHQRLLRVLVEAFGHSGKLIGALAFLHRMSRDRALSTAQGKKTQALVRLGLICGLLPVWNGGLLEAQPAHHRSLSGSPLDQSHGISELVLTGDVRGSQNHTYVEIPFHLPPNLQRVTLTLAYTGKELHTALDLGLMDPDELRCWTGGSKSVLTISLSDATPSCLPGPLPEGRWNVLIGVPNIRSTVTSHYVIHVYFNRGGDVASEPAMLRAPIRSGATWYRGDLHMHTAHSDGSCPSQTGKMVPCPVFFTVDAAAQRGLDFIAITDHNATSHYDAMRELQPYFDKVLLIPGREITTFQGHINFLGSTAFVDFRLGTRTVPDMNTLLQNAERTGALTSINHPQTPSGESCMGCGWTPDSSVEMHLLTAVEVVNGGSESHGSLGVSFWDNQLDAGHRLTGIGGSDNHHPNQPLDQVGSIGSPTTVVYASELSTPAILAGIRAGHVFIDLAATHDRVLELKARAAHQVAGMGDLLTAETGETVQLDMHVVDAARGRVRLLEDGRDVPLPSGCNLASSDETIHAPWISDGRRHWLRVQVEGPDGKMWLLGNPVYVNWDRP